MKEINRTLISIILFFLIIPVLGQEKETPPPGGEPKDFNLPEKSLVEYDNGLQLVMVPWGNIPKATVSIVVKTGNIHEKEDEVWLSDLMADLMKEGSTSMTGNDIADKLASMGGELDINVSPHTTTLNTSVLYEFTSEAIKTMSDVLMNPSFPESEIERLVNDRKRNLSITLARPQPQAREDFFEAIYPNHPYGRLYPTEEMLDSYSLADIESFYNENFGAKRTTIYVVGKFDEASVEQAVQQALSTWKEGPDSFYEAADPEAKAKISIIDRPGAPQSTIIMGLPVIDPSDPDWIPLYITNALLGGSFASRITSNIREDKGYTYSPFSSLSANYRSGVWYEMADVTTSVTGASLQEIVKEINRLQEEPPTQEELEGIQNYQAGIFVLQNSTPGGIIGRLVFLDRHGLDESYLTNYVKNVHSVTAGQIREMTEKYIRPEDMTLVIVGDKSAIESQISEYEDEMLNY